MSGIVEYLPGLTARTTGKGMRVLELDAWANPTRGQAWLDEQRRTSKSLSSFEREVMRNWNITGGTAFYPEFTLLGRERFVFEPTHLLSYPVIRGWDFGWRAPVCVWMQYSPHSDRVYVLREFAPRGIAAHHFRDVCRHLSGQLPYDALEKAAMDWVDMLRGWPGIPAPPWFPSGTTFVDFAGPEVNSTQSIAARDPAEASVRQVFAAVGIEFSIQTGPVKGRTNVLRRLLHPRADGWPGILISQACVDVLAMLDGGLAFRKATKQNPMPEDPRKDGRHDNTNDALTYALVGVVPVAGIPGVTPGLVAAPEAEDLIGWTL